jgi:DNA-binding LytR/AlgR family response regulator
MTAIEAQLQPEKFLRVHRRYIVNLEHLLEIEPLDTGDARLLMSNGSRIPCSRRYRASLRAGSGKRPAGTAEAA